MIKNEIKIHSDDALFLNRVKNSYKINSRYLWLILMLIVLIPFIVISFMKLKLLFYIIILLYLFSFLYPIIFIECRKYIYSVKISNDNELEIKYLDFYKHKIIVEPFENIRLIEFGDAPGAKTVRNFKIYRDFGKGHHKFLINQYEILEWSKTENIERLKSLLNKS